MKVLIDGDACGYKIIEKYSKLSDEVHIFYNGLNTFKKELNCKLHPVENSKDSADYELIKFCEKGDIVVTQDYGLAALALSKKANVFHPKGFKYTDKNINIYLNRRYFRQEFNKYCKRRKYNERKNNRNN